MIGGRRHNLKLHWPRGQTLLELVVVLGLFITMVSAISGSFISSLAAERRALATQSVLSNARATTEVMVRAIRQADPDTISTDTTSGPCLGETPNTCLTFTHPDLTNKGAMVYRLSSGKITESDNGGAPFYITPSNVIVDRLYFEINGEGTNDTIQPRVTMTTAIRANPVGGQVLNLQTSVSLRSPQE